MLILLFICFAGISFSQASKVQPLEIRADAPEFNLPGVDGKDYTLEDFQGAKYLVVIFTCNHCPDARATWGRLNDFAKNYVEKGVQVVAVSSNSPKALMPWENGFSVFGDSFSEMKLVAKERKFVFPYLYDGDKQEAGLAYGAKATPHVFLFGPERKLLYEGHFDNGKRNPGPATQNTVRDNIDALLAGKPVLKTQTNLFGCSTKWAFKEKLVKKKQEEWDALPVKVEPLSAEDATKLLNNKTGKVCVVHFWHTGAAKQEVVMEKLIDTYRRYQRRPFDMVMIGVDKGDDISAVKKVLTDVHFPTSTWTLRSLKNEGRETNNFHLKSADLEALITKLDTSADSMNPLTVVVIPNGEVIYSIQGDVDAVELRRNIVRGHEGLKKKKPKKAK